MRAKEYLSQAIDIEKSIAVKLEQIQLLIPTSGGGASDEQVQSSINLHSFENRIVNYMEQVEKLKTEILELRRLKAEIMAKINLIRNTDERIVLQRRYIICQSWEDISAKMDLSVRHCQRIHDKAIESMEKVLEVTK